MTMLQQIHLPLQSVMVGRVKPRSQSQKQMADTKAILQYGKSLVRLNWSTKNESVVLDTVICYNIAIIKLEEMLMYTEKAPLC